MSEAWTTQDLLELARRQKQILWMVPVALAASVSVPTAVIAGLFLVFYTYKLAQAKRSRFAPVYAASVFIPALSFITLLQLVTLASKPLQAHGLRVGLMGTKPQDLDALRAQVAAGRGAQPFLTDAASAKTSSIRHNVVQSVAVLFVLLAIVGVAVRNLAPVVNQADAQLGAMEYYRMTINPTRTGSYEFEVAPTGGAALVGCAAPRAFPARVLYRAADIHDVPNSRMVAAGASGTIAGQAATRDAFDCVVGNPSRADSISIHIKMTLWSR